MSTGPHSAVSPTSPIDNARSAFEVDAKNIARPIRDSFIEPFKTLEMVTSFDPKLSHAAQGVIERIHGAVDRLDKLLPHETPSPALLGDRVYALSDELQSLTSTAMLDHHGLGEIRKKNYTLDAVLNDIKKTGKNAVRTLDAKRATILTRIATGHASTQR